MSTSMWSWTVCLRTFLDKLRRMVTVILPQKFATRYQFNLGRKLGQRLT